MTKKRIRITDGGIALPLGNNTFLMKGRLHSQGGIGIGNGGKDDIEVEDGEVVKFNKDNIQVLSDQPMLNGISPANALLAGGNFNKIFKAQQSINGNYRGSYGKDGLIKRLVNFITGDKKENKKTAEGEPINEKEVRLRQAYAESRFDSKAGSHAGARGLFQIMPSLLKDYNKANGTNYTVDDLYNDEINTAIRDWKMNLNLNSEWANKNAAPDSVVYAKSLGGYNMGNQNFLDTMGVAKKLGVDIYNTLDWVDKKYLPTETVDYINFVLRNQDNSILRNQAAYEASKKLNKDKVDILNNNFKNGGQINMKLKHKNKQDITDMVMNEIIPHSTGKRKRFGIGGTWGVSEWSLAGNLGLNLLNGLTQGIIGSVTSSKLRKMYDGLKRQSTFIPVTREHINTKVDVEPQLSATKLAEQKLIDNAKANTSSSKVARQQAREAVANRITTDNQIYGDKYNRETQLRNAEAELQTRYNLVDAENKLTDIREQNDFDMQKVIGKANASAMEGQTWGNAVASTLQSSATTLTDYATMTNDLLKSNNPVAYAEYIRRNYGYMMNPDGTLKDKYKGNKGIESFYNNTIRPLFTSKNSTPQIITHDGGLLT